jgi:hypothetical protein
VTSTSIKDLAIKVKRGFARRGCLLSQSLKHLLYHTNFSLVLGTWALAVVGFIAMKDQHRDVERQLDEMQHEQRAWLYAPVVQMVSPMSFDVNGLRMTFAYTVRNTGKNPAVYVTIQTEARIGGLPNPDWFRHVCSMSLGSLGVSVFPGADSLPMPYVTYVPKGDLQNGEIRGTSKDRPVIPAVTVAACATYKDAVTNKWGYTPFAFTIRKKVGPLLDNDSDLKMDDLSLSLSPGPSIPPN